MHKTDEFVIRQFLNLHAEEGLAAILATARILREKSTNEITEVNSSLTLSDCNRKIELEFEVYAYEWSGDRETVLRRLRARMDKLQALRDAIDQWGDMTAKAYKELEFQLRTKKEPDADSRADEGRPVEA